MNTVQLGQNQTFHLKPKIYLNHAAVSPPSRQVIEQSLAVLNDYASHGVGAVFNWVEQEDLQKATRKLIKCQNRRDELKRKHHQRNRPHCPSNTMAQGCKSSCVSEVSFQPM